MTRTSLLPGFWSDRLEVNARQAIFHQWRQLEASGCIENFRIAAGQAEGLRTGWFFADSDAYKWLEAASRIWATHPDPMLGELMDGLISLLGVAQAPDGYLFTYNQIHFPGVRWHNLQIEHELYCHGHLIEAGISHSESTGRTELLAIARRAADRIVADFHAKGPAFTPGHEEIEIALLRLHEYTPGDTAYLDLARQFIEQRGRTPNFALSLFRQNASAARRNKIVQAQRDEYLAAHPDFKPYPLPPGNPTPKRRTAALRWYASALSGKYFQQHKPIREQGTPVGHSVRFGYLETATARLARLSADTSLIPALSRAWERMVVHRMYLTGGLGSEPGLEGFGRDDELDPEYAHAETCAALASLFWNWQMAQLSGEAKYSDLFEWQLYNAALVGMGLDGTTYLYNNPLACRGSVERRPWYAVPCCPSNLSRTLADLGRYIYSTTPDGLRIHQYISSERVEKTVSPDGGVGESLIDLQMESALPWDGRVHVQINRLTHGARPLTLEFRQPSWCDELNLSVNGQPVNIHTQPAGRLPVPEYGFDPHKARFIPLTRDWSAGDRVELRFSLPVRIRKLHPRVKGQRGKVAVSRGPLVYCLEDMDNPGVDIFSTQLVLSSIQPVFDDALLGGIVKLLGTSALGDPLTFIPYFLWGNRGASQMTVWVNA